jgi:hypothetical protein
MTYDIDVFSNLTTIIEDETLTSYHRTTLLPTRAMWNGWGAVNGGDGFEFNIPVPHEIQSADPTWENCIMGFPHPLERRILSPITASPTAVTGEPKNLFFTSSMPLPKATRAVSMPYSTMPPSP